MAGGFLGNLFQAGADKFAEEMAESDIDFVVYDTLDQAGNEGQRVLLEAAMDSWISYFHQCLHDERPADFDETCAMTNHPEAIIEIIDDMVGQVNDIIESTADANYVLSASSGI